MFYCHPLKNILKVGCLSCMFICFTAHINFLKTFYWRIVALQCVSFCYAAKSIRSTYTFIPLFQISFPSKLPQSNQLSSLCYKGGRFSSVIYFIHSISSVYMSIPVSQFIPPLLPPWCPYVCSLCLCPCVCFAGLYWNYRDCINSIDF